MAPPKVIMFIFRLMVITSVKQIVNDSIIAGTFFKILTNSRIKVVTFVKFTNVLIKAMSRVNFISTHFIHSYIWIILYIFMQETSSHYFLINILSPLFHLGIPLIDIGINHIFQLMRFKCNVFIKITAWTDGSGFPVNKTACYQVLEWPVNIRNCKK